MKFCLKPNRLIHDKREQLPLDYLSHSSLPRWLNRLDMIKATLLCMDKSHPNFESLTSEKKLLVDKLLENEEVVDIVLCTIFQWFGTCVGSSDIGDIIKNVNMIGHTGRKRRV